MPDPIPDLTSDDEATLAEFRAGAYDEVETSDVDDLPPADVPAAHDSRTAEWIAQKAPRQYAPPPAEAVAGAQAAVEAARAQHDAVLGEMLTPEAHARLAAAEDQIDHDLVHGVVREARDDARLPPASTGIPPDAPSEQDTASPPTPADATPASAFGLPLRADPEIPPGTFRLEEPDAAAPAHRDDALTTAMQPQIGLDLGIVHDRAPAVKLTDRFVVPPFSTLDSRQDYWKQRKRAWMGLGIQSELGREGTLTWQTDTVLDPDFYRKKEEAEDAVGHKLTLDEFRRDHYRGLDAPPASIQNTGTSIFDPVLCEVAYRWFSPHRGVVLDPFAGGSVRGIVAAILGRRYVGVELRAEQVAANRRNAGEVVGPDSAYDFGGPTPTPTWVQGSATDLRSIVADPDLTQRNLHRPDLIFTCPPYADLEVYSDDPRDLSTAPYATFRAMLGSAIAQSAEVLRDDRFAVWVVGEAREAKTGYSYGIVADTVNAARNAGLHLYNEAILETAIASAAMRATKQHLTSRKLVRVHQHVLIFVKGDARTAALACGDPLLGGAT